MNDQDHNELRILDELWEKNKNRLQRDEKEGEYIPFEDADIESSGLAMKDMRAAGNLKSWPTQSTETGSSYFLRGFGSGKSQLFRRMK